MRFCIVLGGQTAHRHVFAELVESLVWGLGELAHEVVEVSDRPRAGARCLVVGPHLLVEADERVRLPPGSIVYNGEPHCSPLFVRSLRLLAQPELVVWDYSRRTTEFLLALGIPARTVPFAWYPGLVRPMAWQARDLDVVFVGSLSERRRRALASLDAAGLRVRHAFGVYGAARDELVARARVVLNMHYWPESPNEDLRILHAASQGCAVVSEGLPDEPRKLDWAVWTPYPTLAEECARQLYAETWRKQAAIGFAAVQQTDAATVLREALQE